MDEGPSRIALIEPLPRTRDFARQSIRRLGHVPMLFESASQFRSLSQSDRQCTLMLLSCGRDVARTATLLKEVRAALDKRTVIVLLVPGGRTDLVPPRARIDGVAPSPRTGFQAMHQMLRRTVLQQGLNVLDHDMVVGPYHFSPANGTVLVSGHAVSLHALEFDLALQFFRHADSTLSREWLRTMVWERLDVSARAIDMRVRRLRRKLQMEAADGWKLLSNWGGGYRLMSPVNDEPLQAEAPPVRSAHGSLANLEAALRQHMQQTAAPASAEAWLVAARLLAMLKEARDFIATAPTATESGSAAHALLADMDATIALAASSLRT
ncbi:MAG: winged helix-turn-helix domain-containing protein [Pseudomonadota bacterium]